MMKLSLMISLSFTWTGTWPPPIVNGAMRACPPKQNGKRPLVGSMGAHFPGEEKQIVPMPTMALQTVIRPGSVTTKVAKAFTACMIWQAMSGNGCQIGTQRGITRIHPHRTQRDLIQEMAK